jgi:hypothetical protein
MAKFEISVKEVKDGPGCLTVMFWIALIVGLILIFSK